MSKHHHKHYEEMDVDTMLGLLKELPDTWVACRDVKHAWQPHRDFYVTDYDKGKVHEIQRQLVCLRCATIRTETYLPTKWGLEKTAQHYTYPGGYQMHGVPRGVKPSWLIQGEQFRRAMERQATLQRSHDESVDVPEV